MFICCSLSSFCLQALMRIQLEGEVQLQCCWWNSSATSATSIVMPFTFFKYRAPVPWYLMITENGWQKKCFVMDISQSFFNRASKSRAPDGSSIPREKVILSYKVIWKRQKQKTEIFISLFSSSWDAIDKLQSIIYEFHIKTLFSLLMTYQ